MDTKPQDHNKLTKILTVALISGIIAGAINICYMMLYRSMTGYEMNEYVNILSVAISSIVPSVFVGLLYFSLRRMMSWEAAFNVFLLVVIGFTLISFFGPLSNELPNGEPMPPEFTGLTIPMHIIAPTIYLFMIVRAVPRHQN